MFDVLVNGNNVNRIDIYKEVGGFAAYTWNYSVKNLSSIVLTVRLVPVVGSPVISGLENYALVPADLSTVPGQGKEILEIELGERIFVFLFYFYLGLC